MIKKQLRNVSVLLVAVFVVVFGLFISPAVSRAQTGSTIAPCDFTGNLELGMVSEEVRCLQKYLNNNGYKIAEVGVGSPGQETPMFGELTKLKVQEWQADHGISTTGTFGPFSKAEYLKHIASLLTGQLSSLGSAPSGTPPIPSTSITPAPPVETQDDRDREEAKDVILEAREAIEDAEDTIDDSDADAGDIEDMEDDLADAKDDLLEALYSFVEGDYSDAIEQAQDVLDVADDISDRENGDDEDAEEAIDEAREAIEEAEAEIDEAYDDDEEVDWANDLLEEAEDLLDEAEEAFDDEDYEEAKDLADDAADKADDAVDAIGEEEE